MTQSLPRAPEFRQILWALTLGAVMGAVGIFGTDLMARVPWPDGAPHWRLIAALPVLAAGFVAGLAALRVDWWIFRVGLVYGIGVAVFSAWTEMRHTSVIANLLALFVSWPCVWITGMLMIPWAIGRFIYWAGRPHA